MVIDEDARNVEIYGDKISEAAGGSNYTKWIIVGVVVLVGLVALAVVIGCCVRARKKKRMLAMERALESKMSVDEEWKASSEGFVKELKVRKDSL